MVGTAGHRGFGHLRKLPSGRWQASYVGADGARHAAPTTFTHKDDARHWLTEERRLVEAPADWRPPAERTADVGPVVHTLDDVWKRFLTHRAAPLAPATITGYEKDYRLRIEPHWGADRDVATTG